MLPQRRGNSTLREEMGRDRAPEMEEKEGLGFNKRRAEGTDKSVKPKTLQLKMRKLNPVNTICYVQVGIAFNLFSFLEFSSCGFLKSWESVFIVHPNFLC